MHASLLAALALAAVSVKALQVTSPDKQTEWGSSGSHVRVPFLSSLFLPAGLAQARWQLAPTHSDSLLT